MLRGAVSVVIVSKGARASLRKFQIKLQFHHFGAKIKNKSKLRLHISRLSYFSSFLSYVIHTVT